MSNTDTCVTLLARLAEVITALLQLFKSAEWISGVSFQTRIAIFLLLSASLTGCMSTPPTAQTWPATIPPIEHYEALYENDQANQRVQSRQEYLTWIVRCYEGWELSRRGWQQITQSVIEAVESEADKQAVRRIMASLGKKISGF